MAYPVDKIRNICLLGHQGSGKTALAEAMLYYTKGTDRLGNRAEGTTVCDFDPEEVKRQMSISTSVAPVIYGDYKINVLDAPGYFDFEGEDIQALAACEYAIITVSARSGVKVGTEKAVKLCKEKKIPFLFFLTEMDAEGVDFSKAIADLREAFGNKICIYNVPIIDGGKTLGFYDLKDKEGRRFESGKKIDVPVPASLQSQLQAYEDSFNEALAETSDEMMEKFFDGEAYTHEEVKAALSSGIKSGDIYPVMSGSSTTLLGIEPLLHFITSYTPEPKADPKAPAAIQVFKTVADPFVGKMSYFKVLSGTVKSGDTLNNKTSDSSEKIGKLYTVKGKKQTEVTEVSAGDIGVVTKLQKTSTKDVLTAGGDASGVEITYPAPCLSMAIMPKAKGDEEKISQGLQKLKEEDLTFSYETNAETHEQIISGMGDMHLDIIVNKLKSKFGVDVELKAPKIAYREAIRKQVQQQGKHKKQSGGHGQYGDVVIIFEPYEGEDLLFEEKIFGGSVPKNFFPAIEKGLRECAAKGIQAGYPVVGLKATLIDGSYHDVDSSEMSFKMAASIAFKEGLKNAQPTILEPIGTLKVLVPDSQVGDIYGDISKRRGQILGANPSDERGMQEVVAEVPMAEMATYAIDLRAMTRGKGSFSIEFARYQDAPSTVAQAVIEEYQKNKEE